MKKRLVLLAGLLLIPATAAFAVPAHAGVSINLPGFGFSAGPGGVGINIGLPWVVAPVPAPVPVPSPAYAQPDDIYEPSAAPEPPEFVMAPELGFYVAVGVPYDLYFYNNAYWVNRGNIWYKATYFNGPWAPIYAGNIPHVFNRYPVERIRNYRDTYYRHFQRYGNWQGYNHFRPVHHNDNRSKYGYARPLSPGATPSYRTYASRPNRALQADRPSYTTNNPYHRSRSYSDSARSTESRLTQDLGQRDDRYRHPRQRFDGYNRDWRDSSR